MKWQPKTTLIRTFYLLKSAEKCINSNIVQQKNCKMALIRTNKKKWHLAFSLSFALYGTAEWQPVNCFLCIVNCQFLPVLEMLCQNQLLWHTSFWKYTLPRCAYYRAAIPQYNIMMRSVGGLVGLMEDHCIMLRCSVCPCVCSPWTWGFILYFALCFNHQCRIVC